MIAIALQLALVLAVIEVYTLEGEALSRVFAVCSGGWILQRWVPAPHRLAWFLGVAAVALVASLGLADGLWVLGVGGGFAGLCLLPGSRWLRLIAVLGAAAGLALLRVGGDADAPWSGAAWPILASLFLFRAISFLYDRHHERERPSPLLAGAYFFLPPNACLPVFPVVDFGALRRGYDPEVPLDVQREGLERIVRGVLQLLAYRLVYQLVAIPIEDVTNAREAVLYLTTNVFLIVRIMALFHISVGLLHLFGFRLPPTTHLPFFAPGFSEFWRRANVYWRDFVVKVFFYPAYFALKGLGRTLAMVLATLLTFAAAWFLHSYQWFWFRGEFPLRWQDGVYWSLFGVLVAANSAFAARRPARRRTASGVAAECMRGLRIAGTFAVFSVLWSIWMTPSTEAWRALVAALVGDGLAALLPVGLALGSLAALGVVWPDPTPAARGTLSARLAAAGWGAPWRRAPARALALVSLVVLAVPGLAARVDPGLETAVAAMSAAGLNEADADRRTEGYYEALASIPRVDTPSWRDSSDRPDDWEGWRLAGLAQRVDDVRFEVYTASFDADFKGARLATNRYGMRDAEYPREKPPGVFRIALLGASTTAGSGVADDETFEAIVERRLAASFPNGGIARVEILNFAVPNFRLVRSLAQLRKLAAGFDPDWVMLAAEDHFWRAARKELVPAMRRDIPIEPEALREITEPCKLRLAAIEEPSDYKAAAYRCLEEAGPRIVEIAGGEMVAFARERGLRLFYVRLPTGRVRRFHADPAYRDQIERLGFEVIDAADAYAGQDVNDLRLAPWDGHPNARGHALIAERLYPLLLAKLEDEARARLAQRGGL